MPIFEFHCESCGHTFEELVMSAAKIESPKCPVCGEVKTQKMFSTFASGQASGRGNFGSMPTSAPMPTGGHGFS